MASPRKRLKPQGHSAIIESLIQPAIVVGSTLMSGIAAYVLALDEITRLLNGAGSAADVFIVVLCAGMGMLIDMALIVSATRYKMHKVRADPRELHWQQLAKWVLTIGLVSESMTLFYFFVHLSPGQFPTFLVWLAAWIHDGLAISRAFLPPVTIAYFAAGVLPVMFDRADRNREIKSRTSSNIMILIDRLSAVADTDDKSEMLRALGGQLMLDTYATYDVTATTSEDDQVRRDTKLLIHLARINDLDWSGIHPDAPVLDAPDAIPPLSEPPEPPPPPSGGLPDVPPDAGVSESLAGLTHYTPSLRMLRGRTAVNQARARKVSRAEALWTQARALLDAHPEMSRADLREKLRCRRETANALWARWQAESRRRAAR